MIDFESLSEVGRTDSWLGWDRVRIPPAPRDSSASWVGRRMDSIRSGSQIVGTLHSSSGLVAECGRGWLMCDGEEFTVRDIAKSLVQCNGAIYPRMS
jgi:hypothetical protein